MVPTVGNIFRVGRQASVQFAGERSIVLRVTKIPQIETYYGWIWLEGYSLNPKGEAIQKREIFVQKNGLYLLHNYAMPVKPKRGKLVKPSHEVAPNAALPRILPDAGSDDSIVIQDTPAARRRGYVAPSLY